MFTIEIPLTYLEAYNFYQLFSLPTYKNNVYQYTETDYDIIAISENKHDYFLMSETELTKKCILYDSTYFCINLDKVYYSHAHLTCELLIINNDERKNLYCTEKIILKFNKIWIKTRQENSYIYIGLYYVVLMSTVKIMKNKP